MLLAMGWMPLSELLFLFKTVTVQLAGLYKVDVLIV